MLGIDTHVLVRFLVRDDEGQFGKAYRLISHEIAAGRRVFVSQLVLLETEWVLRSRYRLRKLAIMAVFSGLLDSNDIQIEDEPTLEKTLYVWKHSAAHFADCLIGMRNQIMGCSTTATFDLQAAKLPGFSAL